MRNIIFIIGIVCAVAGISVIYWPAALICFGLFLAYVAVHMDASYQGNVRLRRSNIVKPDFNNN